MVTLKRAGLDDASELWQMQMSSFAELLEKYQDYDISPGNEPIDKIINRLNMTQTYFYFIEADGVRVGAIRVVDPADAFGRKRISPLFILKEHRGKGYAQEAMLEAERIHGSENWSLDTILQEKGNCHLYEKLGYRQTGEFRWINDKMTIVFYEKK